MKIGIKDFRCFHEPSAVVIRPINLLIGENSAGKTSFLAATRFLLELFRRGAQPSFNREPFHLGSFDQIAHYRGGRFGRAKLFSFEIEDDVPRSLRSIRDPDLFHGMDPPPKIPAQYKLNVSFRDYKSQPTIDAIDFRAGDYWFNCQFGEKLSLRIGTPSTKEFYFEDMGRRERVDAAQYGLSYVEFLLRDLRYVIRRDEEIAKDELTDKDVLKSPSKQFFEEVRYLSEIYRRVQNSLPEEVYASAPVRSKPERTYNLADFVHSPDGGHMPFVLAQLHSFDPRKSKEIEDAMAAFGKASGLFDRVQVRQIGNSNNGPFQLIVNLPGRKSNIIDVGYGVSQALPIIADLLRMNSTMFLFQQPEVHLHPKAQAELGTFFAKVTKQRRHTLFVETHSDYLLDRIRMEVRKGENIRPQDVSVLYFARSDHDVEIHSLEFDKNGNIIGAPEGYRNFFLREEMRSLGLENF